MAQVLHLHKPREQNVRLRLHLWGEKPNNRGGLVEVENNWKAVIKVYFDNTMRLEGCRVAFHEILVQLLDIKPEWTFGFGGAKSPGEQDITSGLLFRRADKDHPRHWQLFVRWDRREKSDPHNYVGEKNTVRLTLNGEVVMKIRAAGPERPFGCCRGIQIFLSSCGEEIEMPHCLEEHPARPNYDRQD